MLLIKNQKYFIIKFIKLKKRKEIKKIIRQRHTKTPMIKLLIPPKRYRRNKFIDTTKKNQLQSQWRVTSQSEGNDTLICWHLITNFKVGFSWCLQNRLANIFLVIFRFSLSDASFFFFFSLLLFFEMLSFFFLIFLYRLIIIWEMNGRTKIYEF